MWFVLWCCCWLRVLLGLLRCCNRCVLYVILCYVCWICVFVDCWDRSGWLVVCFGLVFWYICFWYVWWEWSLIWDWSILMCWWLCGDIWCCCLVLWNFGLVWICCFWLGVCGCWCCYRLVNSWLMRFIGYWLCCIDIVLLV